jgi:hypothetical protein
VVWAAVGWAWRVKKKKKKKKSKGFLRKSNESREELEEAPNCPILFY